MTSDTDAAPTEVKALRGKTSIIHISAVLHQWDWNGQLEAAKKLVVFSKVGTLVVGHQIGNEEGKEVENPHFEGSKYWRQDPESLKKLWNEVAEQTGTKWEAQAWLRPWEVLGMGAKDAAFMEPGAAPVDFVVERMA